MATTERPVQRPASNSDARKRATERHTTDPFRDMCACGDHWLSSHRPIFGDDGLIHDRVACLAAVSVTL